MALEFTIRRGINLHIDFLNIVVDFRFYFFMSSAIENPKDFSIFVLRGWVSAEKGRGCVTPKNIFCVEKGGCVSADKGASLILLLGRSSSSEQTSMSASVLVSSSGLICFKLRLLTVSLVVLMALLSLPQVGFLPDLSSLSASSSSCFGLTSLWVSRWVLRLDLWLKHLLHIGHMCVDDSSM